VRAAAIRECKRRWSGSWRGRGSASWGARGRDFLRADPGRERPWLREGMLRSIRMGYVVCGGSCCRNPNSTFGVCRAGAYAALQSRPLLPIPAYAHRSSIARVSGYYHRGIDRGADVSAPRPIAVARMRKMREDASGIVAVSPEYRTGTEGIGRLRTFGRSQKEVESGVVFGEGMQSGRREGVHLGSIPGWGAAFTATCRCEHLYLEADSHSTWLVS
jgi:hypothetical protein